MMGSQDVIKRLLWGWLAMLLPVCTAQANTLSKFRVADSNSSAQITLSTSTPPSYKIISLLKQNFVVFHLSGTAALPHYALPRFTGPLIQDIRISETAPLDVVEPGSRAADEPIDGAPDEPSSGVKVEVLLKTFDVTVSHKLLNKPAGLLLLIRTRKARDAEPPSSGSEPAPPQDNDVQPEPLVISSLPTTEAMREIKEGASAAEAVTLLDLYFHRPTVFAATPSLLWSVATAYAGLGLYEEAQVLYTRISEQADNPRLQAAALLKRGKIAVRQRE
jgi:hypothetical protein